MDPRLAALFWNPTVSQEQIQAIYDLIRERDDARRERDEQKARAEAGAEAVKAKSAILMRR